MGTDSTATPTNNVRDLLVARSNYHQAKYDLLNIQIVLHDARAALDDARSRRPICDADIATLQQSVYAYEDSVTLAKAKLAVASTAIERLMSLQARRMTAARQIGKLLLSPGSGLVDLIFDDEIDPELFGDPASLQDASDPNKAGEVKNSPGPTEGEVSNNPRRVR